MHILYIELMFDASDSSFTDMSERVFSLTYYNAGLNPIACRVASIRLKKQTLEKEKLHQKLKDII